MGPPAAACEDRPVDFLRTPDTAFADLPDWPYQPRYSTVGGDLRLAFVDEGPADSPVVLLMHGLVAAEPERFAAVIVANTGMPTGQAKPTEAFLAWQTFSQTVETFPVGFIVNGGSTRELNPAEIAAYNAPFPTEEYKAGPRQLPSMVPTSPEDPAAQDNVAAWEILRAFTKPFVCAFSDNDTITKGGERAFIDSVPGTAGQPHETLSGGHFLQEDCGPAIAALILSVVRRG